MVFFFAYYTRMVSTLFHKHLIFWFEAFWDYEKGFWGKNVEKFCMSKGRAAFQNIR